MKKHMLEIAIEIKRLCEEHDLRYYLAFGSLIGAVRHSGFIPWDDDIDFVMPRKDYDEFIEICKNELNSNFRIRTLNEKGYIYYFAKVDDVRTTLIESNNKNKDYKGGVFVDIFPMNGLPNGKISRFVFVNQLKLYNKLSGLGLVDYSYKEQPFIKKMIIRLFKNIDGRKYLLKYDKLARKYDFDSSMYVFQSCDTTNIPLRKELFDDVAQYEFEGIKFNSVKNYDEYLRLNYGDYMQLPPEDERTSVHYFKTVDMDKSYLED